MRKCLLILALLLLTAGCQKVTYEKTIELGALTIYEISLDPPTYQQPVKIWIDPSDGAVSAYLVKESDLAAVKKALNQHQVPDAQLVLISKTFKAIEPRQVYSLETTVPAKTGYALVLFGGGQANKVKVKVVGK